MQAIAAKIDVRDLTMAYGDFVIQRDLTFEVADGDIFIIMGAAGAARVRCCATWWV